MLTFATVAAGKPSSMAPLTKHMLTQTVPKEVADLGRYYTRGMELGVDEAMMRQDMHPPGRRHRDQRAARRPPGRWREDRGQALP